MYISLKKKEKNGFILVKYASSKVTLCVYLVIFILIMGMFMYIFIN